ncbi:MAG: SAM-dependent methyltransferase, partial [Candidatus Aenigmarchaeota archaeon]|nr:SAM-dependent methyltransferase [Candidatus Aenigmarchaeota archaeon]
MVKWTKEFTKEYEVPHKLKHEVLKPSILKMLGNVKGKQIVDLGCGSGHFSRILA